METVLKNHAFNFGKQTLKQLRRKPTGIKFAPPYSIIFMTKVMEEFLTKVNLKTKLW